MAKVRHFPTVVHELLLCSSKLGQVMRLLLLP